MVKVNPKNRLKCMNCKSVYHDSRKLLHSAGVADGKEYFNTKCPDCGEFDTMSEDYVGIPDNVLDKYYDGTISYQEMISKRDAKLEKKEKKEADNI